MAEIHYINGHKNHFGKSYFSLSQFISLVSRHKYLLKTMRASQPASSRTQNTGDCVCMPSVLCSLSPPKYHMLCWRAHHTNMAIGSSSPPRRHHRVSCTTTRHQQSVMLAHTSATSHQPPCAACRVLPAVCCPPRAARLAPMPAKVRAPPVPSVPHLAAVSAGGSSSQARPVTS